MTDVRYIDLVIDKLMASDEQTKALLAPTDDRFGKGRFCRNLFYALFCGEPKTYFNLNGLKVGNQKHDGEETFFNELLKVGKFQSLRDKTVRNLTVSNETLKSIANNAWSIFNRNAKDKQAEYLLDDGELSAADRTKAQIRAMSTQAADDAEELMDMLSSFGAGMFPSDNEMSLPTKEMQELLASIRSCKWLDGIIKMLGRCISMAKHIKAGSMKRGGSVPHKFELGNDIASTLPAELAMRSRLKKLFMASFAEGSLLQDMMESPVLESDGSIIIVCDETGSMKMDNRNQWAKALSAAIFLACQEEKKDVIYIPFGWALGEIRTNVIDVLQSFHDYSSTDLRSTVDGLCFFLENGRLPHQDASVKTSIDLKKSDILFITDAEADGFNRHHDISVARNFNQAKRKLGLRMLSIIISEKEGAREIMAPVSDEVIQIGSDPSADMSKTERILKWML